MSPRYTKLSIAAQVNRTNARDLDQFKDYAAENFEALLGIARKLALEGLEADERKSLREDVAMIAAEAGL
jgi:hypothetical protein